MLSRGGQSRRSRRPNEPLPTLRLRRLAPFHLYDLIPEPPRRSRSLKIRAA